MEAVTIEQEFLIGTSPPFEQVPAADYCLDALPVTLISMNAVLMCQYIEFVAD
jgi:hypothetical protein